MKRIIAIAALSTIFAVSEVHAAGGTINFTGTISTQTCNAAVNGSSGSTAAAVSLPTVPVGDLATQGKTGGQTSFKMEVTGCMSRSPSGAGTVKAFFEKGPNVDSNVRLINTATSSGNASNVVLELVDGTGNTAIKAGDIAQNNGNFMSISSGSASLPYSVRYYSTGTATAGTVTSSVIYSLIYN